MRMASVMSAAVSCICQNLARCSLALTPKKSDCHATPMKNPGAAANVAPQSLYKVKKTQRDNNKQCLPVYFVLADVKRRGTNP